jgi:hypothetical protein
MGPTADQDAMQKRQFLAPDDNRTSSRDTRNPIATVFENKHIFEEKHRFVALLLRV